MTNIEKYNNIFAEVFAVDISELDEEFTILNVDQWDSVAQMVLITELEDNFDIMLETDDIISLSSYTIGKDILSKYGVEL